MIKISYNHSWPRLNQHLDLADCTWKLYFLVFFFSFLFSDSFWRIITTCAYNPCSIAIFFSKLLWLQMVGSEVSLDYFYIGPKILSKKFCCCKKWIINNFVYWSPFYFFGNIFNVYIHCFFIFQSLLLLFYWNNHVAVVFVDSILFLIYISIIISLFIFLFFFFL